MNRAAMRALREQAAALNDMLALLRKRMRITEFYGQRGQTARKSGCHTTNHERTGL